MEAFDRGDIICLHLDGYTGAREESPVPAPTTATGIGDALEIGDAASSRVNLLQTLSEMEDAGLVHAEERAVVGYGSPRTVYFLTDTGRERATEVRERLRDESVVVTNGTTEEAALDNVGRFFEEEDEPLVTALARLTSDGKVPIERESPEGFVDRVDELATLQETVDRSFTRESQTAIVHGVAGTGKTSLAREAVDRLRGEQEVILARGVALEASSDPYRPLREAFETIPGGDQLRDQLVSAQSTVALDDPGKIDVQRRALFDDVADGLRDVATERRIVLFLDNLQWADEATLGLFEHLATSIDEFVYPIAFVGAYRDPAVATAEHPLGDVLDRIERNASFTDISLAAFSRAETHTLLTDLLRHDDVPQGFVELVYEATGGNPLFVHETMTHLLETEQIDPAEGEFPVNESAVDFPDAVTDQIEQRLSLLDSTSRQLLRVGAIIGERAPRAVLAAVSELSPANRREYTDLLVASGIWEPAGGDGDQAEATDEGYIQFVSGALREAVVERLPDAMASDYHARVAAAFVSVYDDSDEQAARVAHHYEQAGRYGQALEHYRRAGEYASASHAHEDAVSQYERALELATEHDLVSDAALASIYCDIADVYGTIGAFEDALDSAAAGIEVAPDQSRARCRLLDVRAHVEATRGEFERAKQIATTQRDLAVDLEARDLQAEAIRNLGHAVRELGEFEAARSNYEESLALSREIADRPTEATTLVHLSAVMIYLGEFEDAAAYGEQALAIAREVDAKQVEANSLGNLGVISERRETYRSAREYYEQCLDIMRELGDRHGMAKVYNNLGVVASKRGDLDDAREYHERALTSRREVGDRKGVAISLTNLGVIDRREGAFRRASERHEQSLAIKREIGDRRGEAKTLQNLGLNVQAQAEYDEALEYFEESLAIYEDIGDKSGQAGMLAPIAEVEESQGDYERARECQQRSLALSLEVDDQGGVASSRQHLGVLARLEGDYQTAREQTERSLEIEAELDNRSTEATCHMERGRLARVDGEFDTAAGHFDRASELIDSVGNPLETAMLAHSRGRLALDRGDPADAREYASEALEAFEAIPNPHWIGRCQLLLGDVAAIVESPTGAHEHWGSAVERFTTVDAPQDALRTLDRLVEYDLTAGATDCAAGHFSRAEAVFADAPDATKRLHRDWITDRRSTFDCE